MHRLTLCMAYYMNQGMLDEHLRRLEALPQAVKDELCVNVCDDGSPNGEAQGRAIGCPLRIFRIDVDVRWNQDAARNICADAASTPWLLLTDIDHLVPQETFEAILLNKLNKNQVYRFQRTTLEADRTETLYKPHPNSWLMTRSDYWQIGGYDERFAGLYGTDADFRDRVARFPIVMLPERLIRVPRSTIADASTTTYQRKQPVDDVGIPRNPKENIN